MNYKLLSDFKLSWKLSVILNLVAGAVFVGSFFLFFYYYIMLTPDKYCVKLLENSNQYVLYAVVGILIFLHEFSHGIGYRLYGGRVTYGIKYLCPYCREVSGIYYPLKGFALTLTMPIIVITGLGLLCIIFFPQYTYYSMMGMLFNLSGATGDLIMLVYILFKKGKKKYVKDEPYGFSLYEVA